MPEYALCIRSANHHTGNHHFTEKQEVNVSLLNRFSVKKKVSAGFVLMQIILLAVSASALLSLLNTKDDVVMIADDIQPAVLKATELQYHLERANSSLGFYLLSQEENHKKSYTESLSNVDAALADLQAMELVQTNEEVQKEVTAIAVAQAFPGHSPG